jgi:hypothetical protein
VLEHRAVLAHPGPGPTSGAFPGPSRRRHPRRSRRSVPGICACGGCIGGVCRESRRGMGGRVVAGGGGGGARVAVVEAVGKG